MNTPKLSVRLLTTSILVVVSIIAVSVLYKRYVERPWTRSGQVQANIVRIAPRVAGLVLSVAVIDNQPVKKGDLLFEIDPSDHEHAVTSALSTLALARNQVASLEATIGVKAALVGEAETAIKSAAGRITAAATKIMAAQGRLAGSLAGVDSAGAGVDSAKAGIDGARASVTAAKAILLAYEQQHDRAVRLAEQGAGAVAVAQGLEQAVASGKAAVEAAEASLPQARSKLEQAVAAGVQAEARHNQAKAAVAEAKANEAVAKIALQEARARLVSAQAQLIQARTDLGKPGEENVRIQSPLIDLKHARHHLKWTKIYAPDDGHVTNVRVSEGDLATAGKPMLAFVSDKSYYVIGFFKETQIAHIHVGAKVAITLMGHPDAEVLGEVESLGLAINPPGVATLDGPEGLVPAVSPSFDWIRLAHRVPVRVKLTQVPKGLQLIAGTTASVAIQGE